MKLSSLPNFPRKKECKCENGMGLCSCGAILQNMTLSEVGELECPSVPIKLIKTLQEYIVLLGKELDEVVPMASVHGWKSSRYEEGKVARRKIQRLQKTRE